MELKDYILEINQKRPVYMPYITAGDPDMDSTVECAVSMIDAGIDVLELGIPFSDPTADGPVIEEAMVRAMAVPTFHVKSVLEVAARIHQARPGVPIVLLTYMNPIIHTFAEIPEEAGEVGTLHASIEGFFKVASQAGVRGMVVPDLPFDEPEAEMMREIGKKYRVSMVAMVAPNTTDKRKKKICKKARGFIYYVTSMGVTGERKELPPEIVEKIQELKDLSGLPVLAGFGISSPDQVKPLMGVADGVIVGSLNQRLIKENGKDAPRALHQASAEFMKALGRAE